MIHPIVKYGEPVLEKMADKVTEFNTPDLKQVVADMFETMYAANGVGLAAPQIGLSRQIAIIDISNGQNPDEKLVLINPEILTKEGSHTAEEGCLSIPGFREPVTRPRRVTMRAQDVTGAWWEKAGEELLARAMLHETDHLFGILFIQHLSVLKRDLIRRKIRKMAKSGDWS